MYESVEQFSHPAFEARVAKAEAARLPADYDHQTALARIPSLEAFLAQHATSEPWKNRELLERHAALMLRAELVAAHAAGVTAPVKQIPHAEIATVLLGGQSAPPSAAKLVDKLSCAVAGDKGEHAQLSAAIADAGQTVNVRESVKKINGPRKS